MKKEIIHDTLKWVLASLVFVYIMYAIIFAIKNL